VTASAEADGAASLAVDGLMANRWGAGFGAPQWIDIDLGAPTSIGRVRLFVTQTPDGPTTHRLWGRASTSDPWVQFHELAGSTVDNQVLEHTFETPPTNIRHVRVDTAASVSWVSWREIEIYAP
jgi:hypothetical protein